MNILVQDIKRDSEQSIILAKELIISKTSKTKTIHFDNSIKKKKELIEKAFENYHLALYQFSYSSFLEVMLLENFDKNYLDAVHDKIIHYMFSVLAWFNTVEENYEKEILVTFIYGRSLIKLWGF